MERNCMPAQWEQQRQQQQLLRRKQTTNVKIVWRQPFMKHPTLHFPHFRSTTNSIKRLEVEVSLPWPGPAWLGVGASAGVQVVAGVQALISCRLSRQISCDMARFADSSPDKERCWHCWSGCGFCMMKYREPRAKNPERELFNEAHREKILCGFYIGVN